MNDNFNSELFATECCFSKEASCVRLIHALHQQTVDATTAELCGAILSAAEGCSFKTKSGSWNDAQMADLSGHQFTQGGILKAPLLC